MGWPLVTEYLQSRRASNEEMDPAALELWFSVPNHIQEMLGEPLPPFRGARHAVYGLTPGIEPRGFFVCGSIRFPGRWTGALLYVVLRPLLGVVVAARNRGGKIAPVRSGRIDSFRSPALE